jgi:hypothetical protein
LVLGCVLMTRVAREVIAQEGRRRCTPSTGATSADRLNTQKINKKDAILNFRPVWLTSPPVAVHHSVFAKFVQMMVDDETNMAIGSAQLEKALEFVLAAAEYYEDETQRAAALRPFLQDALPISHELFSFESQKLTPDHCRSSGTIHFFPVLSALLELRNEVGEGGSNPLVQAECDYVAVSCSEEVCVCALNTYSTLTHCPGPADQRTSCCPAFLMGMLGRTSLLPVQCLLITSSPSRSWTSRSSLVQTLITVHLWTTRCGESRDCGIAPTRASETWTTITAVC